jgi:hypothetical protein
MYGLGSSVPIAAQSSKGKEPAPQVYDDEADYDLDEEDDDHVRDIQAKESLPIGTHIIADTSVYQPYPATNSVRSKSRRGTRQDLLIFS